MDLRAALADLVRQVDHLEASTPGALRLDDVRARFVDAPGLVETALEDDVLLLDHRLALAGPTDDPEPVVVCRLNRHHPLVRAAVGFD